MSPKSPIRPSRLLKKAPGEGTGPTKRTEFMANLVGRVPSRGIVRVFQQPARDSHAAQLAKDRHNVLVDKILERGEGAIRRKLQRAGPAVAGQLSDFA